MAERFLCSSCEEFLICSHEYILRYMNLTLGIYFQSSIKLIQLFLHCQGNCLCSTVNNRGKVIYCYGDLVPRGDEILGAEAVQADGGTSSNDLLLAQLGVCTFGICVL